MSQAGTGQYVVDGLICGICAADLMFQVSKTLELLENQPAKCPMWAERSWALRKCILGYEHSDTFESMCQYAKALYRQNRMNEAMEFGTRAVELIATTQQPPSLQARSFLIQAILMTEDGLYKEAEDLYSQCVELCKEYYGPDHVETLLTIEELANNYRD